MVLMSIKASSINAINGSNQLVWDQWLQDHYLSLLDTKGGTVKPHNMRWFASMVSDLKRLLMQGGVFAYPGANRKGYEKGHLRLVYEAIPMSFLIHAMGGSSTDGDMSLLEKPVTELHEKTPTFIGRLRRRSVELSFLRVRLTQPIFIQPPAQRINPVLAEEGFAA